MITTRPSRHAELPFIRSFILASLLFSSCRTGRTPPAVPGDFPMPDTYATATAPGTVSTNAWWEMFQDSQLNHLVARARAGNLSLAQAAARVRQSRALAVQAAAGSPPSPWMPRPHPRARRAREPDPARRRKLTPSDRRPAMNWMPGDGWGPPMKPPA